MKNMFKYALVFAFAGGAALFTGCRADEEVDLAGYPETPVGATISVLRTGWRLSRELTIMKAC